MRPTTRCGSSRTPSRRIAIAWKILVRQGKEPLARKHLAKIVPLVPNTAQGFLRLAEVAGEAHDAAVARHAIDRALGVMRPEWHWTRFRLVRVALTIGDERAIEMIRDLIAACEDPKTLRALFTKCYEQDYRDLALAAGEKFHRIAPADYEITTRLENLRFVASRQKPAEGCVGTSAPGRGRRLLIRLLKGGKKSDENVA